MRNATAYGVSPSIRIDLVVNNLVGYAYTTGEILMKSDGSPWRPLVHIEDISRAFLAVLEADRDAVHDQAFNVGRSEENYRIREIAEMVGEVVPDCRVAFAEGASPDTRNYRVNFDKIAGALPAYQPVWTVRKGIEELYAAYRAHGLTKEEFLSSKYLRIKTILEHRHAGRLDDRLRWAGATGRA
jgi:nucleoside-diphosphate-sugar epimerase